MKTRLLILGALLVAALCACDSHGNAAFGATCRTGNDCASDFCVSGEASTQATPQAFCSEDCTGKAAGASCGGPKGRCAGDFSAWCWLTCETDAQCKAVNVRRPVCRVLSSSGKAYPFSACSVGP